VVGQKVSKTQLLIDTHETACSSIGLPLPLDAPAIRMFRMVIAEARSLIRQRNEIEAQADGMLRHSQDYQLLRQILGIGPINAPDDRCRGRRPSAVSSSSSVSATGTGRADTYGPPRFSQKPLSGDCDLRTPCQSCDPIATTYRSILPLLLRQRSHPVEGG
jgi:hypothetical protein